MVKVDGCNASFRITKAFYPPDANFADAPSWIELQVQAENWNSATTLTVSIEEIDAVSVNKKCPLLSFKNKKARDSFRSALISELSDGLEKKTIELGYYFSKTGATVFADGSVCFLRGAELLGSCSRPYLVAPEYGNTRLLGDGEISSEILSLLLDSQFPVLLVFAYVLLTSVRSLLIDSEIDLQAILYIEGRQGLGKTTLATRVAGIYENDGKRTGIVQAESTLSAVNAMMVSLRDQPLIVDDLCLSVSRDTARKRIDLASKLIRQATGNIPIIKRHGKATEQLPCEAGIILTAEFPLENMSDLTRCLIVPIKNRMDLPGSLKPEVIGEAVRHYSSWFSAHSEEEIKCFRSRVEEYVESCPELDVRMGTNYACLEAAFQSFVRSMACEDTNGYYSKRLSQKMRRAIQYAQEEHMALVKKIKSTIPVGNLAYCIHQGYCNEEFNLCKKTEKLSKHDGILWKDDLCLRLNALVQFVRRQPGYQDWSSKRIVQELKDIGVLVMQEESAATVHITKGTPRVYRIRLKALENAAERY